MVTKEVIVIGGGIIGLACALELKLRGKDVTVISGNFKQAATHAAAGMLAPSAEGLTGVMLELGQQSLALYPQWIDKLQHLGAKEVDYNPCGIIAPVYSNSSTSSSGQWLDRASLDYYQPGLGHEVVGAWWYPQEGQVNPRLLGQALLELNGALGVELLEGVKVSALHRHHHTVTSILTNQGKMFADTYILAGGAWSGQLLPLPVRPIKGQMLSLKMPSSHPLHRVIFGENTYLVPKCDGRLIVGATVEDVGWQKGVTGAGINILLQRAIKLYPPLADWNLQEIWYGYRPGTPDEMPILGYGDSDNLILATGHHRNGILLAPVTAQLISNLIDGKNDHLITPFSYQRFLSSKPQITASIAPKIMTYPLPMTPPQSALNGSTTSNTDPLIIAGRRFSSRLMTGTGKYPSREAMQQSVIASGCEIVTVAIRRVQNNAPGHEGLAEALDWTKIWMLPNTAGCTNAEEAVRVARLGREMAKLLGQEDNNFVKLEVIPDSKYLLPDPIGTLQAAEQLVKEGFAVLPYVNADPLLCKRLEEVGCATVMPLGSPIGSGQGIQNTANIKIIIEQSQVPVVIDAGIGCPSEATFGMEMGADALLINSAIAMAQNPVQMAKAMGMATEAGRLAYQAGRIPIKTYANASSPLSGLVR
ncbi:MAG: glycine oxidase ThiO [Cyanobacterium sp. T60_A2020_053]|nr:glycine oxidase ThiO [Cyanobacterium sp. T60_A2020_053]